MTSSDTRSRAARVAGQRSFDDIGSPLHEVTFCVVDVETTGGSPDDGGLTEIGAVKLRGGECLGTFQTLVNPGLSIPTQITVLTGITQAMVIAAPRPAQVLGSLLEFMGGAVIVGHNVRYDLGYLNAALERAGRPKLANPWVDTCALARRLVRDEVANCKLGTLARAFRLPNRPCHRALDDALATGDLLHLLLERASAFGVLGLDDLLALPRLAGHPQVGKLRLTDQLPRCPGVYLFCDRGGRVLYVGKASNLRSRVRSYFSGDERRKVGQLLREVQRIDHIACASSLEAAVLEVRLIHHHRPRFNRQAKTPDRYAYLKLTAEAFPRLSVVRAVKPDGAFYLGPLSSTGAARRAAEAIQTALPIRRCSGVAGRRSAPCAAAQLGVALCPCDGGVSEEAYREVVNQVKTGLSGNPSILLGPLAQRMEALAGEERFEEAADMRDRAAALVQALRRQRRFDSLRRAGRVVLELPGRGGVELSQGQLVSCWGDGQMALAPHYSPADHLPADHPPADHLPGDHLPATTDQPCPGDGPPDRSQADELTCVGAWLEREAAHVRIVYSDGGLASAYPPLPTFAARKPC